MIRYRTIGSLIATILIGALTFLFATPNKIMKSKAKSSKTSVDRAIDENDGLFI